MSELKTGVANLETDMMKCANCIHNINNRCRVDWDKKADPTNKNKNYTKIKDPKQDCFTGLFEKIDVKAELRESYENINQIIDYYMDINEKERNIITLWIIGTYFHKNFSTFPYLFANAMRGSGKTRLLKIIAALSESGVLINSPTEAILFRTVGTLCLDEFEGVGGKEKSSLRELLNSAYKKGTSVFRMRKQKSTEGELQVVEKFQPYRPIVMANIWGMEEVLGDRCISVVIEKSLDGSRTLLIENFEDFLLVNVTKNKLKRLSSVVWCTLCSQKDINIQWNTYVKDKYSTTPNNTTTHTTYNYTKLHKGQLEANRVEEMLKGNDVIIEDYSKIFKQIYDTEIDGRHLELFLPLFLIAADIEGEHILDMTLEYAKEVVQAKKVEEITESKDVLAYTLASGIAPATWINIKALTTTLRLMVGDGENDWCNSRWVGRAMSRLKLVKNKRRMSEGVQVILDVEKAERMKQIFRPKEDA